ncbi:hypothetical protein J3L16_02220 [Alteromonas sp. 5E99-2]|uniref:hypothetical protein n=1 Tax=Alteromonas sp. 5E99-2 TaxID=2817683 RepID=UPI001A980D9F|nr:hypothetical protein [Alteromonas sp. 5E99-2]MBO1254498.1 hypothetical protein [Alteromonas sp. 5E99-2]
MPKLNLAERQTSIYKLAVWLLSRLANPAYRNELIGDLEEEYTQRQQTNQDANHWLFRQTMLAIWDGQKTMVKSTGFVKGLSLVLCVLLLPTIALFVGWLSNMNQPSEQLWRLLLAGEVHLILFNSEYWTIAWNEVGISRIDIHMFINTPSIVWAMLFAASSHLFLKHINPSIWFFCGFVLIYMLLPYLFGHTLISLIEPIPQKVGPILAFMILAPFWSLPLFLLFLFKGFSR